MASLTKNSEFDNNIFAEFDVLLDKFTPVLIEFKENDKIMDTPPVSKAVESLKKELKRIKDSIRSIGCRSSIKHIEELTQDLGRSLGLVLFASIDVSSEIKENVAVLHKELIKFFC